MRAEFITDAANYILRERSSSFEPAPTVGVNWTTHFIKCHSYKKAHQKTLNSVREASEDLDSVNEYLNKLKTITRDESIVPDDI